LTRHGPRVILKSVVRSLSDAESRPPMYSRALILCAALALLIVSPIPADDPPPKPAPEKPRPVLKEGADLPGSFRPYNAVNGKYPDKFHSLITEYGLNPTVMVFVQGADTTNADAALPSLLQQIDQYIVERPKTLLSAFAVFLFNDLADVVKDDDMRKAHAEELVKLKAAAKLQQTVLTLDSAAALQKAGYEIDPQAQVVVVLYDKVKVKRIYTFKTAMTKADVDTVVKEVKEKLAPFKK
jgi:hypothetical protein